MNLQKLYRQRFASEDLPKKLEIWSVLCSDFFSKLVKESDIVVDIGAGHCEFINNINCKKKIAIDINPAVKDYALPDVDVRNEDCKNLISIQDNFADVVFMSNFLEHLQDKQSVYEVLKESRRILKFGGLLIILQPNIRLIAGAYWDFFDHHTPLTEKSLIEITQILGMDPTYVVDKFLPYTTKSSLPQSAWLVKLYLKIPLAWKVFGKQSLIVVKKSTNDIEAIR